MAGGFFLGIYLVVFLMHATGVALNIFGIGTLEILMVLIVALFAIGPGRLPGMAQKLGELLAKARREVSQAQESLITEIELEPPNDIEGQKKL